MKDECTAVDIDTAVGQRSRKVQIEMADGKTLSLMLLHCALAAAQCIVIGPVCLCVGFLPR